MQDAKSSNDLIQEDHDLQDFQQRAVNNENSLLRTTGLRQRVNARSVSALRAVPSYLRKAPRRYLLHLMVLSLLPVGLVVNKNATTPQVDTAILVSASPTAERQVRPALGLMTMTHRNEPAPLTALNDSEATPDPGVGDGPITSPDFDDSLVIPVGRPVNNTPTYPEAVISGDIANLRNGPSTEFDRLDKLDSGTKVKVVARHADWVQVRTEGGQEGWLAADLVDLDQAVIDALPDAPNVPTPPPAKVGKITQDNLNLRDGPGTDYISMKKLGLDNQVSLLARYQGWYQIETGEGTVGWVSAEFLNLEAGVADRIAEAESIPSANPALVGWATDEGVNLRSGPSTKFDSLGKLSKGAELGLLARYKEWVKVETAKGTKGWISQDLVDVSNFVFRRVPFTDNVPSLPVAPAPKKSNPAKPQQPAGGGGGGGGGTASGDVASMAWAYVGYSYRWGGESPSGFDCSGLTKYLYRQVGVSLPHSAAGQYSSAYGTFIGSMSNLQPGDLLFYAGTAGPGITHVGIYVGDGIMVNAMTPASGVGAVSIYSSYWLNHYYGALRPYR